MAQRELFGPKDNTPKVSTILKKAITKERLIEASKIYKSGDNKTSAQILRDLNDKRIPHQPKLLRPNSSAWEAHKSPQ